MAHRHESLNRLALSATIHCLTGCSIGEVAGMILGTSLNLTNATTIALSIILAFAFGYLLTMQPLLRAGVPLRRALGLAFASDTVSITIMEIVDNALMLIIPGAMDAKPNQMRFWWSLALSLVVAGLAAFPIVRWLISRGRGARHFHPPRGSAAPWPARARRLRP